MKSYLQPFRFVEYSTVHGFILYLNSKIQDNDIPKKSCIAGAVNTKVVHLETITFDIIEVCNCLFHQGSFINNLMQRIQSKVSVIWDGWSTCKQRPFTSFSISFIDLPPGNDTVWELKKHLLEFNSSVGRHTGILIGMDLLETIYKFWLEKGKFVSSQLSFLIAEFEGSLGGWSVMGSVQMMLLYELCAKSLIQMGDDLSLNKFEYCKFL